MDQVINAPVAANIGPVQLGFLARSLAVENPTGQWWYVNEISQYISPYTIGAIYQLTGVQQITILATPPPGLNSPALTGQAARFTATDQALLPTSGTVLTAPMITPPNKLTPLAVNIPLADINTSHNVGDYWFDRRPIRSILIEFDKLSSGYLAVGGEILIQTPTGPRIYPGERMILVINSAGSLSLYISAATLADDDIRFLVIE